MIELKRKPGLRRPLIVAISLVVAVVAAAAAVAVLRRVAHLDDGPPPPVVSSQKPNLAGKSPDELRTALVKQADLPEYLKVSTQSKSPVAASGANPPDCLPHQLEDHDSAIVGVRAHAPDFNGMFYDGRYAVVMLMQPKDGRAPLVDSARDWLARCGSFTVSLAGSPEPYPAYLTPLPAEVLDSEGAVGIKMTYAFAKSDPFRNEVFYYTIAQVRGVDLYAVSGLPGVSEDLARKTAAKLAAL